MTVRILIADDHRILREGLRALLDQEPDFEIVAEAENGHEAVDAAERLRPDVIIMDIAMPDMSGIDATELIRKVVPEAKVLALSMHSEKRFVREMARAGANGYLLKDSAFDELIRAIHTILSGETYLDPAVDDVVAGDRLPATHGLAPAADILGPRERQVLRRMAEGQSTREIADGLRIGVKTVETYRYRIMQKLNLHNVADLTKFAIREGFTALDL